MHDLLTASLALRAFTIFWRGALPPVAVVLAAALVGWLGGA